MSKKVSYQCDTCSDVLEIEYPDDDEYEFQEAGWTDDNYTTDTHYCKKCRVQE